MMVKMFLISLKRFLFPVLFCTGLLCTFSITVKAQDTITVKTIDSIISQNKDSASPSDEVSTEIATAETRKKHIYDSSERFFNSKDDVNDVYVIYGLKKNAASEKAVTELKNDKEFWYVGEIEKFQLRKHRYLQQNDSLAKLRKPGYDYEVLKKDKEDGLENIPWLRTVLWVFIIGILVFALVYFLTVNNLSFFARKDIVNQNNDDGDAGVNIFQTQFAEMLAKARAEKNFRLMTRILYLQTLRLLSDKDIIRYSPNYSNRTYIDQLRTTDYYADFFTITRHYEYVWYGRFDLTETAYAKIEAAIDSFQKRLV